MRHGYRRASLIAATLVPLVGLACAAGGALATGVECGTLRSALPAAATLSVDDTLVVARLVFVSFPDSPDHHLPVWADSLARELEDFFATMSNGRRRIAARVVKRGDDSTRMWPASQPASHYAGVGGAGWWAVNAEVLAGIAAEQPGVWDGVEHVWAFHDQCAFACTDASSPDQCEDTCPWGGIAGLGVSSSQVPGLTAGGTTQRFLTRLPAVRQHRVQAWFAAHEYGHRLANTQHSPGSDASGDAYVNYGRYDLMRSGQFGSPAREEGLTPYHPLHLAHWGWKPAWIIARDTVGVRLPDLLSPRGGIAIVAPPGASQSFVLVHHGGHTSYDAKYAGSGVLVWHVRPGDTGGADRAWDLESAAGRGLAGASDPIDGRDPLEADVLGLGSAADFFTGGALVLSGATNPASRLYDDAGISNREVRRSGVSIENLRTDPTSGDRLVDVYVTPSQALLAPLGGETVAVGDTVAVRWGVRASAEVASVDVLLSRDGGATWSPLASGRPNDGAFAWVADAPGQALRVRVASRDPDGNVGFSESPADFAIGSPPTTPASFALGDAAPNPSSDGAELPLELAAPARVRAEIVDAAGRRVRVLADRAFAAGRSRLAWDGRDERGRRVPPGIYFARVRAGETSARTRIVRVR